MKIVMKKRPKITKEFLKVCRVKRLKLSLILTGDNMMFLMNNSLIASNKSIVKIMIV